jgi:hypothetical protein
MIDEKLRVSAGLEKLYPYEIVSDLTIDGRRVAGLYDKRTHHIQISEQVPREQWVKTYLHEIAHRIATPYLMEKASSSEHNEYFATLLATMYRRTNSLWKLSVYDFFDTDEGQSFYRDERAPSLTDVQLVWRFRYAITRSAHYASTQMTIEEIAEDLWQWETKRQQDVNSRNDVKEMSDLKLGIILGAISTAIVISGIVWSISLLAHQYK